MKKTKIIYLIVAMICFGIGAYTWKVSNTGTQNTLELKIHHALKTKQSGQSVLVYVAGKPVTLDDLDFEYTLHTKEIFDSEELVPIPDLGVHYEKELSPLKESLLTGIVERRLLFEFIRGESDFDIDNPSRFTACLKEWQETVDDSRDSFFEEPNSTRLKERLCERSILEQFIAERLQKRVSVSEEEIEQHYEAHYKEFYRPKRVLIRQIVLASENEAKKARYGLKRTNFESRARKLSITPEARDGGILGPFAKGELPRLFDIVFSMRRGEIYGILKSTYGFHLIMLEKKLPASQLELAQVEKQIREKIFKKKLEKEVNQWVEIAQNSISIKAPKSAW